MSELKQKLENHLISRGVKFTTNPQLLNTIVNVMVDFINQEYTEKEPDNYIISILHPTGEIESKESNDESILQDVITTSMDNKDSAIFVNHTVVYMGILTQEEIELFYEVKED